MRSDIEATDSGIRVAADINQLKESMEFTNVSVVVANESHTFFEQNARRVNGTYATTVPTAQLDTGLYHVYVGVRGTEESFGRDELLGFSSTRIRVTSDGSVQQVTSTAPTDDPQTTVTDHRGDPGSTDDVAETPDGTAQPGFGALVTLVCVLGVALIVGRIHRQ